MITQPQNASQTPLEDERRAEHTLTVDCIRDVALTVPFTVALLIGVVVLAVRGQDPDWGAWLPMAVALGIWTGLFFGMWIAFVRNASQLQKIEVRAVNTLDGRGDEHARQSERQHPRRAA